MKRFIAVACLFWLVGSPPANAEHDLVISTAHTPPLVRGDGSGFLERIAHEAFRRIDHKIDIVMVPSERSLINVNTGIDDGELFRVAGLQKLYPALRRVPEPLHVMEFSAFVRDPAIQVSEWQDLVGHTVGIIRGWKILEDRLSMHAGLKVVTNADALFAALQNGEIDAAIFSRSVGLERIHQLKPAFHLAGPPLLRSEMFMYLHEQHAELIAPLNAALLEMKQDGTYHAILRDFGDRVKAE